MPSGTPPEPRLTIRPATPADAEAMDALAIAGIATYRDFAPDGWEPPAAGEAVERTRAWLAGGDAFALVADDADGGQAGHVMVIPASRARAAADDPRLAHLGRLFLRPDQWGTGLAADLLHRALADSTQRGFTSIRLFSAAGQARARRFYEREGFAVAGPLHFEGDLGLDIVEYRRPLP